jgi:hypothetical protein
VGLWRFAGASLEVSAGACEESCVEVEEGSRVRIVAVRVEEVRVIKATCATHQSV